MGVRKSVSREPKGSGFSRKQLARGRSGGDTIVEGAGIALVACLELARTS